MLAPSEIVLLITALSHLNVPCSDEVAAASRAAQDSKSSDLIPLYGFLENTLWRSETTKWTARDIAAVLKLCTKLQTVTVVGILAAVLWPAIHTIAQMGATDVVTCARTYQSFGIHHPEMHSAIKSRTEKLLPVLSVDDLCRIGIFLTSKPGNEFTKEDFFSKLFDTITERVQGGVSSLNPSGVTRFGEIFAKKYPTDTTTKPLEIHLEAVRKVCQRAQELISASVVADVAGMIAALSPHITDATLFEALMTLIMERVMACRDQLRPEVITQLFEVCEAHSFLNEGLLNVLAESACQQVDRFEISQLGKCLKTLAAFDLYDGEFFTMTATKVGQITKQKILLDPECLAELLAAFAKVKEKNETLLYAIASQVICALHTDIPRKAISSILAGFQVFKFDHRNVVAQLKEREASSQK